jgi:hypothetical protein
MRSSKISQFVILTMLASLCCNFGIAAEQCVFHRRPFASGEISNQTIRCDLNLEMAIRQGETTIESSNQAVRREQQRQIKIVEMGDKAPTKAIVSYKSSAVSVQQADAEPMKSNQPVSGKSYYVSRIEGKLSITTIDGQVPPPSELALLQANLEAFGLPNPIATYFDGRTMHVGETVDLPIELARELLGFQEGVGNISSLNMTLSKILNTKSGKLAVFNTQLTAKDSKDGVNMTLEGQLAIETESCRTAVVNLAGPVSVDELRGPKNGQFEVTSRGELKVAVRATYETKTQ